MKQRRRSIRFGLIATFVAFLLVGGFTNTAQATSSGRLVISSIAERGGGKEHQKKPPTIKKFYFKCVIHLVAMDKNDKQLGSVFSISESLPGFGTTFEEAQKDVDAVFLESIKLKLKNRPERKKPGFDGFQALPDPDRINLCEP